MAVLCFVGQYSRTKVLFTNRRATKSQTLSCSFSDTPEDTLANHLSKMTNLDCICMYLIVLATGPNHICEHRVHSRGQVCTEAVCVARACTFTLLIKLFIEKIFCIVLYRVIRGNGHFLFVYYSGCKIL